MYMKGFWFAAESSTRNDATLQLVNNQCLLCIGGHDMRSSSLAELDISDRLGDMPRRVIWPDGGTFETRDNETIDAWLADSGHKGARSMVLHRLESSWGWVATALLVTVLVAYLGIRYGVPATSETIARKLPPAVNEAVSTQTLAALDRVLFQDTETSASEQEQVQQQFDELIAALPENDFDFKLHFRRMRGLPNAMALPGGDVVVTDAFLDLVEHPQELDSVLLHEIGHVVEHHGMTQAITASTFSVIASLAFGDLNAMGEVAASVPVFMMQSSYSRNAESEADAYAFARMQQMGKDPKHFADIILRLSDEERGVDSEEDDISSYFSSHPDSRARARKAREASRAQEASDE